jgi:hypothetical protein
MFITNCHKYFGTLFQNLQLTFKICKNSLKICKMCAKAQNNAENLKKNA